MRVVPDLHTMNFSEVARNTGISRSQVSRILRGKTNPSIAAATKIAASLSMEVQELLTEIRNQRLD